MGNYCQSMTQQKKSSISTYKLPLNKIPSKQYSNIRSSFTKCRDTNKSQLTTNDFEPYKFLGTGCYGSVVVVRKKDPINENVHAMKVIDKNILKDNTLLVTNLLKHKNDSNNSSFLVQVQHVFENQKKTFILMQYVPAGNLLFYIQKSRGLNQQIIKDVSSQILIGLKYLNKMGTVHTSLKPQNILVSSDGHIKITDYFISTQISQYTKFDNYRGIIQYTSPEILNNVSNSESNSKIDIWSFGVLLYQMMYAHTPFVEDKISKQDIKKSLLTGLYKTDQRCSKEFKDLLSKLLSVDISNRPTIQQIQTHQFFLKVDWNAVSQRRNQCFLKQQVKKYNTKSQHSSYIKPKRILLVPSNSTDEQNIKYSQQNKIDQ